MIAALLLSTTILMGWSVDTGEPVYTVMLTMDEVKASPEYATMMRNRYAHALVELRAAERVEVARAGIRVEADPASAGEPSAQPGPASIQWRSEVERWRSLVARYFQASEVEHALAIIRCESVGDPDATNPSSGTAGLFQHRPRFWQERSAAAGWAGWSVYNPEANVAVAAFLVSSDGWSHWSGRAWNVDSCEEWAQAQGV